LKALCLTSGGLISAQVLSAWVAGGHSVAALWIGPLERKKFLRRDHVLGLVAPSWSIATLCRRHRIPVRNNPRLSTWREAEAEIRSLNADVLISSLSHQIVPEKILKQFDRRAVNFHPALLPHYRGPNPRAGMILDGTASLYGGVTVHVLTGEIDLGDIIGLRSVPYVATKGFIEWNVRQARAARELVETELKNYLDGSSTPSPQSSLIGNYRKVHASELTLSERQVASSIAWLCDRLGDSGWLRFRPSDVDDVHIVHRFLRQIGPPTFTSPRIGPTTIEFDAADARVRVRRRWYLTRLLTVLKYWIAIARTAFAVNSGCQKAER
jgi:methionyl-tRNA formyltransferase